MKTAFLTVMGCVPSSKTKSKHTNTICSCFNATKVVPVIQVQECSDNGFDGNIYIHSIRVPLTEKEVFLVLKCWEHIHNNIKEAGAAMFRKMFEQRPDVEVTFRELRDNSGQDYNFFQRTLEVHGLVVMSAIDELISNLEDEKTLSRLILQQGRTHARFGGMTSQMFWAIEMPFLEVVKEWSNLKYNKQTEVAFEKMIKFFLEIFELGFEQGVKAAFGPYGKPF